MHVEPTGGQETAVQAPRVLVLDDHVLIRESVTELLRNAGMQVVGECSDAESAIRLAQREPVDVALVDIMLEGPHGSMDGMGFVRALRAMPQPPRVIILSAVRDPAVVQQAYDEGAFAYLHKIGANRDTIVSAIRAVARGERLMAPTSVAESLRRSSDEPIEGSGPLSALSHREREVLACIAAGADNLKIAAMLDITERTVRAHVSALYRKLGRDNRTELALMARDLGLRPRTE